MNKKEQYQQQNKDFLARKRKEEGVVYQPLFNI